MKGQTLWSYQPYRPFLRDMGQIHICRLVPTENAIHLEWLPVGEAEYEIWISLRDADSYACCGTTSKTEFDIRDLPTDTDFSIYVKAGEKESAQRLVRTGERVGTVVNYLHKDDPYYDFSGNFICIIRLSAKGTDGVMKPVVFRTLLKFVTISTESSVYYRTRGGEWWGCIAATPHLYMVSVIR